MPTHGGVARPPAPVPRLTRAPTLLRNRVLCCRAAGGNAKTLMIVAVSPDDSDCPEADQSLQYATRVKRVKQQRAPGGGALGEQDSASANAGAAAGGAEANESQTVRMLRKEIARLKAEGNVVKER